MIYYAEAICRTVKLIEGSIILIAIKMVHQCKSHQKNTDINFIMLLVALTNSNMHMYLHSLAVCPQAKT